jgi:hypothetical protein
LYSECRLDGDRDMDEPKRVDEHDSDVQAEQTEIDEDEAIWDKLFADPRSEILLNKLAEQARKAHREGRTISLDSLNCDD